MTQHSKAAIETELRTKVFHFLMAMSFVLISYGVYMSPLIRFANAPSQESDFKNRNKILSAKLLKKE